MSPDPPGLMAGDSGGFLLAVDPDFDPEDPDARLDESPGFDGSMRILTSLLWDDWGVLDVMQVQTLSGLWPLAMHHPLTVYTGPVVDVQKEFWTILADLKR